MILHGYFRSSAAYRTRIALNLKGVAYEQHDIDLRTGAQRSEAFLKLNPQGLVPALEVDGTVITQIDGHPGMAGRDLSGAGPDARRRHWPGAGAGHDRADRLATSIR